MSVKRSLRKEGCEGPLFPARDGPVLSQADFLGHGLVSPNGQHILSYSPVDTGENRKTVLYFHFSFAGRLVIGLRNLSDGQILGIQILGPNRVFRVCPKLNVLSSPESHVLVGRLRKNGVGGGGDPLERHEFEGCPSVLLHMIALVDLLLPRLRQLHRV